MPSLIDRGGSLFDCSASLTEDETQCCGCVAFNPTSCECQTANSPSGTIIPATLYVTMTGSSICSVDDSFTKTKCADITGHDWSGTYIIVCDDDVVDDPLRTLGKTVNHVVRTFFCTAEGSFGVMYDYYLYERLTFEWRIGNIAAGVRSRVKVIFATSVRKYASGADPDVDSPIAEDSSTIRSYAYDLSDATYTDDCGTPHQACGYFSLSATTQGADWSSRCGHSSPTADYQPSQVKFGNI